MRLISATLLALAVALPVTACSSAGGSQELSDKPVTLRFTWWGADERQKRTEQVIDIFEKAHPNITVKGEFKDWNGYWDVLATSTAANDAPDVIQMDELYLSSYASRGALLDLGTSKKYLHTDAFDANALATGTIDGKQYALPVGLASYSVIVNTDLLAKYKIPLPDDSTWTWADLKSVAAQVSKASGGEVTGFQSMGFDTGGLNVWARQAGASLYDDKGDVAIPAKVLTDFWSYIADLTKAGVAPPPSVTVERASGQLTQSGTATNKSAFGLWWNTQLTALAAASGQNLKLLKLPGEAQAQTQGAYYKSSMYWSVSARSKQPAEAALLVDFLANNAEAAKILLTERGVPANKTIRQGITTGLTATDNAAVEYLDTVTVDSPPRVTPKGASDVEAILKRHTEDVLFGRVAPAEAAEAFIKELQAGIDAA